MSASTRVGHDVVSGHWKGHGRLSNEFPNPLSPGGYVTGTLSGPPPPRGLTWTPEISPELFPSALRNNSGVDPKARNGLKWAKLEKIIFPDMVEFRISQGFQKIPFCSWWTPYPL